MKKSKSNICQIDSESMMNVFDVFGKDRIHDALMVLHTLESNRVDPSDYARHLRNLLVEGEQSRRAVQVRRSRDARTKRRKLIVNIPDCLMCGRQNELIPINTAKGIGNVYGWGSLLFCDHCGHEEFSTKTMNEQLQLFGVLK